MNTAAVDHPEGCACRSCSQKTWEEQERYREDDA